MRPKKPIFLLLVIAVYISSCAPHTRVENMIVATVPEMKVNEDSELYGEIAIGTVTGKEKVKMDTGAIIDPNDLKYSIEISLANNNLLATNNPPSYVLNAHLISSFKVIDKDSPLGVGGSHFVVAIGWTLTDAKGERIIYSRIIESHSYMPLKEKLTHYYWTSIGKEKAVKRNIEKLIMEIRKEHF